MSFDSKLKAAASLLMDEVRNTTDWTYWLGGYPSGTPLGIPLHIEERLDMEPSVIEAQVPEQYLTAEGLVSDLEGGEPDKGDYMVGPVIPGQPVAEHYVVKVLENDGYFFKVALI